MNSINQDEYTLISGNRLTTSFHDVESGKLLFVNLPPSESISMEDLHRLVSNHEIDIKDTNVSVSEEGTTLRVFYNKKWYTATKSKLQAFRSNWADKTTTFGASFAQAVRNELGVPCNEWDDREFLEDFYERFLDKSKVYFFLLRSTEGERIVCDAPRQAKAIHICTQENYKNDFTDRINIGIGNFSHTRCVPSNLDKIKAVFDTLYYRNNQGLVVEHKNSFYKILLPNYAILSEIRGTTSSLKLCYMTLRSPANFVKRSMFLDLYDKTKAIEELEAAIFEACLKLHSLYMAKYVLKQEVLVTGVVAKAMFIVHKRFLEDRIPTTPSKINDVLTEHPNVLNHLLKVFGFRIKF